MAMAISVPWYVYFVANDDLREIYIGAVKDRGTVRSPAGAKASVQDRWRDHCAGNTQALAHWACKTEKLRLLCWQEHPDQEAASAAGHEAERDVLELALACPAAEKLLRKGYSVIQTSGV